MQEYIKPMLPAELSRPFDNEDWLFEKNLGGFRAIVVKFQQDVKIYANKYQLFNLDFPQLVKEFGKIPINFVLDGEIMVHNEDGEPDIIKLMSYKENPHLPVCYYAFDILRIQDQSMLRQPLLKRKEFLKGLLPSNSSHIIIKRFVMGYGCDLYKTATKENLEGITAKKFDGIYRPGKVTSEWLKIKVRNSHEVYISQIKESFVNNFLVKNIDEYKEIKQAHD